MSYFETFEPSDDKELTAEENEILSDIFGCSEDDYEDKTCFYDSSYQTIFFAIIITILFIILASPSMSIWFSCYVPDPYFNLLSRALLFFIFVFFIDLSMSYYDKNGIRNHDHY